MPDSAARTLTSLEALAIGEWRVDPAANELTRAGTAVRVEPKVMQVLLQLAECAGGVVAATNCSTPYGPAWWSATKR